MAVLAIAGFVFYRWKANSFDWNAFGRTFTGVNWLWLAASLPFILAAYLGRALRWEVMVRPIRPDASIWRIFVATAIGFTAIVFFGRAGELVRPYLIAKKERVTFSSQMAAWLLERILDLMMVLLIFGFALAQISRSGVNVGPRLKPILQIGGTAVGLTAAICLAVLLLFRYFTETMQARLMESITFLPSPLRVKIEAFLSAFLQGMQSTRSNSFVLQLLLYSVLEWILIILCYACLIKAFPVTEKFQLTDIMIFMGFVSFGAAVQLPGIGGGAQVASILVFTELFHLPLETATGMALVLWAVTFLTIVPIGVALAFHEGVNWKQMSHISEDVDPATLK